MDAARHERRAEESSGLIGSPGWVGVCVCVCVCVCVGGICSSSLDQCLAVLPLLFLFICHSVCLSVCLSVTTSRLTHLLSTCVCL